MPLEMSLSSRSLAVALAWPQIGPREAHPALDEPASASAHKQRRSIITWYSCTVMPGRVNGFLVSCCHLSTALACRERLLTRAPRLHDVERQGELPRARAGPSQLDVRVPQAQAARVLQRVVGDDTEALACQKTRSQPRQKARQPCAALPWPSTRRPRMSSRSRQRNCGTGYTTLVGSWHRSACCSSPASWQAQLYWGAFNKVIYYVLNMSYTHCDDCHCANNLIDAQLLPK